MMKNVIVIVSVLFLTMVVCGAVSATNINVNPGIGIQNAINNASNGDTLNLTAGTYNEHNIMVDKNLTITGPQTKGNDTPTAVVDAQDHGRVFNIATGVNVTLQYLLIQNGNSTIAGGIYNVGTLTLKNITCLNNSVNGSYGGALVNDVGGNLTIIDSNFTGNTVTDKNYGALGGAIVNCGALNISNSIFTYNTATGTLCGGGGAIYEMGGTLTVTNCTFTNNIATTGTNGNYSGGGALYNAQGVVVITDSTFNDNIANGTYGTDNGGGAIANYYYGTLTVTNSNFINNKAVGTNFYGGAIYNSYNATAEIIFNRIYGNLAINGFALYCNSGSVNATLNWWDSNNNPMSNVYGAVNVIPWLVMNLTTNQATIGIGGTSNITADLLHDSNGGYHDPAKGHVPDGIPVNFTGTLGSVNPVSANTSNGSAVTSFTAGSNPGVATINATVDGANATTKITIGDIYVSTTGSDTTGDGSQNNPYQTILKGITMIYNSGTLHIANGTYSGTNNTNIALNKNVNIIGQSQNGTILNGTNTASIFRIINNANVIIKNLTLTNAQTADNGGAIYNDCCNVTIENCTLKNNTATNGGAIYNSGIMTVTNSSVYQSTATKGNGGGIYNSGTLTLTDSSVYNNSATLYSGGGGIYNDGTMAVINSSVYNNSATWGGGIVNFESGTMTLTNSSVYNNTAYAGAGGIYNGKTNAVNMTLIDCSVYQNTATNGDGGGIMNFSGTLLVTNSSVYNNTAAWYGGGIRNYYGTLTVTDSSVYNNSATQYGGAGIYNCGTVTVTDSSICNNSATLYGGGIYNDRYGTVNLTNSIVDNNTATNGGAIYNESILTVSNCTLTQNVANDGYGGAIYNDKNLNVNDSAFNCNTAFCGGAIYSVGGTSTIPVNIAQSTFKSNNASWNGGAIYNAGNLGLTDSKFTNNQVNNNASIWDMTYIPSGGAIYNAGNLSVVNSTFTTNNAGWYGGAILSTGNLTVTDSTFTNNQVTLQESGISESNFFPSGGAINNLSNDGYLNVFNSSFNNNSALYAGAIYNRGILTVGGSTFNGNIGSGGAILNNGGNSTTPAVVSDSTFIGNNNGRDFQDGGAIFNFENGYLNLTNSIFTNNTASGGRGGAIHNQGNLSITDCIFTSNSADRIGSGGAISNSYGNCAVKDSIFTNNVATRGGVIYNYNNPSNTVVTGCTFIGNSAVNLGSGGVIYNSGNLTAIFNRIFGNTANQGNAIYNNDGTVNASFNWWGTNQDPSSQFAGSGAMNYSPWIYLNLTADPAFILNGSTSTIIANFNNVYNGTTVTAIDPAGGHIPDGLDVVFTSDALGSVDPLISQTSNGIVTTNYTAGMITGISTVNATMDNQIVLTTVHIVNPLNIVSVNPDNGTVNVPANQVIKITFNEPITAGNAYNNIKLKYPDGSGKPINLSINGNVLTITPKTNLAPDTRFTIYIPSNAITDSAGGTIASTFTSKFTTVSSILTVTNINPINGALDVPVNQIIIINFNEPITAGSAYANIRLKYPDGSGKPINLSISGKTLTITPKTNLAPGTTFTIYMPKNAIVISAGGTLTAAYTSTFTTVNSVLSVTNVTPTSGAINVPVNQVITINFNEPITAGSANSNIRLKYPNGSGKPITTSINGNTLTITPNTNLALGTTFTIYIPVNAIINSAGASITTAYISTFTTVT